MPHVLGQHPAQDYLTCSVPNSRINTKHQRRKPQTPVKTDTRMLKGEGGTGVSTAVYPKKDKLEHAVSSQKFRIKSKVTIGPDSFELGSCMQSKWKPRGELQTRLEKELQHNGECEQKKKEKLTHPRITLVSLAPPRVRKKNKKSRAPPPPPPLTVGRSRAMERLTIKVLGIDSRDEQV